MDFLKFYNTIATKANNFNFILKNLDVIKLFLINGPSLFSYRPKFHINLGQKEIARTLVPHGQDFQSSNLNSDY